MKTVTVTTEELKIRTQEWTQDGTPWHFHMINPGCILSDRVGVTESAILAEVDSTRERFLAVTGQRDMALGELLARRAHRDVFEGHSADEGRSLAGTDGTLLSWIASMEELNRGCSVWHHHMFMPGCALNQFADCWQVVFEAPSLGGLVGVETCAEYPFLAFRAIEALYWAQERE